MTIGNYNINDPSSPEGNQKELLERDRYGDPLRHNSFVTVIPVEYPRQKFQNSNTVYNTSQNFPSQEDIRNYKNPTTLVEKDHSEMSSIASVSTQSSHVMNRGMPDTATASAPRIPNGQCKFLFTHSFQLSNQSLKSIKHLFYSMCFPEQWRVRMRRRRTWPQHKCSYHIKNAS